MEFVAAVSSPHHPPVYKILRTIGRRSRVVGWGEAMRSFETSLGCCPAARGPDGLTCAHTAAAHAVVAAIDGTGGGVTMNPRLSASPPSQLCAALELSGVLELAVAVAVADGRVHAWAAPLDAASAGSPARLSATIAPPRAPVRPAVAADPWRLNEWATPGVHPALCAVTHMHPGDEEVLLVHRGETDREHVVIEGLNSNVLVREFS